MSLRQFVFEFCLDSLRGVVQVFAIGVGAVAGWKAQRETITLVTRKDVEVCVEDFLAGGFAVREKEVYAFTLQTTLAQSHRQTLRDAKYLGAFRILQVADVRRVPVGDYQHVTGIDRMKIHEG